MKPFKALPLLLCALLCAIPLAGCKTPASGNTPSTPSTPSTPNTPNTPTGPQPETPFVPHSSAEGVKDRLTAAEERSEFSEGSPEGFYWADGYSNGNQFNCTWRKSSAAIEDGIMRMSVLKEGSGYAGAEYRTETRSSYGFYAVCMKAAKCSGVISSFFTYTNAPVWDEIDIEFLGKNTAQVQFNYYTSGKGGHEFIFDLGFDAAEEFHEYAFEFAPDSITWYIDGTAVYRAAEELPSHPMQIMMNVWNCRNADEWSGAFDASALPVSAEYRYFAFVPAAFFPAEAIASAGRGCFFEVARKNPFGREAGHGFSSKL